MADTTISTYLELRDHMSGGLDKAADALREVNTEAKKVTATLDSMGRMRDATSGRFIRKGSEEYTAALRSMGAAHTQLGDVAVDSTKKAESAITSLSGKVSGLIGPLTAAVGAFAGFSAFRTAISLGQEFEDVSLRIAGTIKAFDIAPTFDDAVKATTSVMGTIQELAAALPGETEDYITVFAQALPKSIAAGLTDVRKVADFTSRYTAVAVSNMIDSKQAGLDLFRMLSGQAGADVRTWTVLMEKIGLTADEFNKLAANVRQAKIDQAIRAFDDQLKAAGDTFSAKFGEMKSRLKEIVRLGSAPLFEGVKDILSEINLYLQSNQMQLREAITGASTVALDMLRNLPTIVQEVGDRLQLIWDASRAVLTIWAGTQLLNGISAVAKVYEGIRNSVVAISAASASGGIGQIIAKGGVIAAAVGTAAYAVKGAQDIGESKARGAKAAAAQRRAAELRPAAMTALEFLKEYAPTTDQTRTMAQFEHDIAMQLKARYTAGEQTADIQSYVNQLAKFQKVSGLPEMSYSRIYAEYQSMSEAKRPRPKLAQAEAETKEAAKGKKAPAPRAPPKERALTHWDFRHSRFDIRQEFAEGFDPDRIAVAFANDLSRLGEMKLQGAYGLTGATR